MKNEYDMHKAKRGAIIPTAGKTRITLYLDDDILNYYREHAEKECRGYQTLINETLRELMKNGRVDSIKTLRRIIREELKAANK